MEWRDAVGEVAKVAPAVAAALGGPAAGGITAGASRLVTGLLGIDDDPAALVAATQDPEKRAALIRLNQEHERQLLQMRFDAEAAQAAEQTARLAETQKTMRAELGTEGWWRAGWRPALGWVFAAALGGLGGVMVLTIAREPSLVSDPEFTGMLIWLFVTMGGALGINVRERSKDKARQLGMQPSGFLDAIRTGRPRE